MSINNIKKSNMDRKHVENILPSRLESYIKEFEDDMTLNELNIHDKTLQRSGIACKWARFSYEEERYKKEMLKKIDKLKISLQKKLYDKRKQQIEDQQLNSSVNEIKLKIDVEKLLKDTPQFQQIKDEIEEQDDIIRFIAEAKQIIGSFGFDIKNSIEVLKLENI